MGKILKVTMRDVAKAAGVAQATVSLAFSKHPSIPVATRERIEAVARRIGYRPHGSISTLMAQIRMNRPVRYQATLGAITSWPHRTKWKQVRALSRYYRGAQERAEALGFRLEEFWLGDRSISSERLVGILNARHIEGLVIFPRPIPGPLEIDVSPFATAAIGYTTTQPGLHRTTAAHYECVVTALRQLHRRGYRRVGMVVDARNNDRIERKWVAAFCAYELDAIRDGHLRVQLLSADDHAGFARWIKKAKPDALISAGLPTPEWLARLGLKSPDALGLVMLGEGYYNEQTAFVVEYSELVGAAAVDLVVAQLQRGERGIPPHPKEVFINGGWQEGETLLPPAPDTA